MPTPPSSPWIVRCSVQAETHAPSFAKTERATLEAPGKHAF